MLSAVIGNTIRQAMRSGALPVCCAVLTGLLALAAFASWRRHEAQNAERDAFNNQVRTQWLQQPDRHPHRVAHYGYLAFRNRSPLSFFDSGVETYTGTAIFLEAHRQNPANFSEAGQSPALIRLGELTPALVLQLIVPLLIFFLGFASISGERENGTLVLMLAQGLPPRTLILGKVIGLSAIAAALLLPGTAIVLLLMGLHDPSRLLLLALSYALYFAICALVAVLASARLRSSRAALTAVLLLWVGGCVVMPRALQSWGAARAPVPSRAAFDAALEAEMEKVGNSHNPNDPHFAGLRARILAEHGVQNVADLPFNYSAYVMKETEAISSAIFERHYTRLIETFRQQGDPLRWGAFLNPYIAIRQISAALAASDLNHFIAFQKQAEAFRFDMIQKLNDLHLHEIKLQNDRAQKVSRDRWQGFAAFQFQPPSLGDLLPTLATPAIALAAWIALLLALIPRRLTR